MASLSGDQRSELIHEFNAVLDDAFCLLAFQLEKTGTQWVKLSRPIDLPSSLDPFLHGFNLGCQVS